MARRAVIRTFLFTLPLGAALALQQWAAEAPAAVEAIYSARAYPRIAAVLSLVNGLLPFALADVLALAGLTASLVLLLLWARLLWTDRSRALGAAFRWLLQTAGLGYLAFQLLWGLNYRRQPLAASLGLDTRPAPVTELAALAEELTVDANVLRVDRREEVGTFRLETGLREALRLAADGFAPPRRVLPPGARPKGSLLSPLLARLGISGIFIPFTGEPLVDTLIPEVELPFSASHELAHLEGWAREDEASFVASIACRGHAAADFRYSGALMSSLHAVAALAARDPEAAKRVVAARSPAVGRDVAAIRAWQKRYEGALSRLGDRVNDTYLRSQGDPRGLHSYGRMVDLLLAERRAGRLARSGTMPP